MVEAVCQETLASTDNGTVVKKCEDIHIFFSEWELHVSDNALPAQCLLSRECQEDVTYYAQGLSIFTDALFLRYYF